MPPIIANPAIENSDTFSVLILLVMSCEVVEFRLDGLPQRSVHLNHFFQKLLAEPSHWQIETLQTPVNCILSMA